jgi:eukaryotic-like serine/threonine-protein kinase
LVFLTESMKGASSNSFLYRFGPFELDTAEGKLSEEGTRIKLQDLPYRLLLMLVERPGSIVTREEVKQRLWPQNTFLEFDNSLGVAVRKVRDALGDDAEAPRYVETIPRRGYRFLVPVERLAAENSATTFVVADQTSSLTNPKPWSGPSRLTVAICVVSVLLMAAFSYRLARKRPSSSLASTPPTYQPNSRRSVAVLGFRNLRGRHEDDWMSHAFSEMLSTELGADGSLRIVSDEAVAIAKRDIAIVDADSLASATLTRLRKNPGADVVVLGSYTPIPGKLLKRIRLDIRVQDTLSGDTIAEDAVSGTEEELFEMAAHAGADLRTSLGIYPLAPEAAQRIRASLPANSEAVRHYSQGSAKLWAFDFMGAREELSKAVAADPNYPLAHSALCDAFWHLGYRLKASAEAKRALDLSTQLPEEEQLIIAGQYARSLEDWPNAVKTYKTLFRLRRDNLDYGLLLAAAQLHSSPREALRTLDMLRALPAPVGEDARIDLLEASAQIGLNLPVAQTAAKRAVAKGTDLGSPLLVARAYGILCQQGPILGATVDDTARDCQEAMKSYSAAGDRNNEARALNDFAGVSYSRGDLRQAEKMWRDAAKRFRQLDEREGVATTSLNLGETLLQEGKLTEGKRMLEAAIPEYEAIEDSASLALVLNDLGYLARLQGDLQSAEASYQKAKGLASGVNDYSSLAYILNGEGDLQKDRADLASARSLYTEAVRLRTQIGEIQNTEETNLSLAKLSIEMGQASQAEGSLRKSREQFHREQQLDDEISAGTALAEAMLAQDKLSEASDDVDAMATLASKTQNKTIRLEFQLTYARVLLRTAKDKQALALLEQVSAESHKSGFAIFVWEEELLHAELLLRTGRAPEGKQELLALQKTTHQNGFELLTNKAAALCR